MRLSGTLSEDDRRRAWTLLMHTTRWLRGAEAPADAHEEYLLAALLESDLVNLMECIGRASKRETQRAAKLVSQVVFDLTVLRLKRGVR